MRNIDDEIAQARAKLEDAVETERIERTREYAVDYFLKTVLPAISQFEDPSCAAYTLWVELIHVLAHDKWPAAELVRDLEWHMQNEAPWVRSMLSPTQGRA